MPDYFMLGPWTHAILSDDGELVGVAQHVELDNYGLWGIAWCYIIQPESLPSYMCLDGFEVLPLGKADPDLLRHLHATLPSFQRV